MLDMNGWIVEFCSSRLLSLSTFYRNVLVLGNLRRIWFDDGCSVSLRWLNHTLPNENQLHRLELSLLELEENPAKLDKGQIKDLKGPRQIGLFYFLNRYFRIFPASLVAFVTSNFHNRNNLTILRCIKNIFPT